MKTLQIFYKIKNTENHVDFSDVEFYNRYIQWGGTLHLRPRRKIRHSSYNDLLRQEARLSLEAG